MADEIHRARFADLSAGTLYDLLRLRSEVFVVEQDCPYLDLDGRDTEPDAEHRWIVRDGAVVACLRVLRDPDGAWRIGRVVTAPRARSAGLAAALIVDALAECGRPVVIDAQAHLADWYGGFGFRPDGAEFLEDGIPHVPMRLP